ncbi:hypothetical protein CB1_001581001 [Camelus ferus]|nr:hypothetical protein CB1_001581001 [Camelus ferus]
MAEAQQSLRLIYGFRLLSGFAKKCESDRAALLSSVSPTQKERLEATSSSHQYETALGFKKAGKTEQFRAFQESCLKEDPEGLEALLSWRGHAHSSLPAPLPPVGSEASALSLANGWAEYDLSSCCVCSSSSDGHRVNETVDALLDSLTCVRGKVWVKNTDSWASLSSVPEKSQVFTLLGSLGQVPCNRDSSRAICAQAPDGFPTGSSFCDHLLLRECFLALAPGSCPLSSSTEVPMLPERQPPVSAVHEPGYRS